MMRLKRMNSMFRLAPRVSRTLFRYNYSAHPRQEYSFMKPIEKILNYYEDIIGLTDVRVAQAEVIQHEEILSEAQKARREKQFELKSVQSRLKEIHNELDRTPRGDDRYLELLTEEHITIKLERQFVEQFELAESSERDAFQALSNRVRLSHEKERERGERTKYWSIFASLIGALLGIIGTTVASELRMRRIKEMVPIADQFSPMLERITSLVEKQNSQVSSFINDVRNLMEIKDSPKLELEALTQKESRFDEVVEKVNEQNVLLAKEMDEVKRMIAIEKGRSIDGGVIYVGDDMETLLDRTQKSLESKMKLQMLMAAVFLYAAISVSIPLFGFLFKD